jgi:hypothetical protein
MRSMLRSGPTTALLSDHALLLTLSCADDGMLYCVCNINDYYVCIIEQFPEIQQHNFQSYIERFRISYGETGAANASGGYSSGSADVAQQCVAASGSTDVAQQREAAAAAAAAAAMHAEQYAEHNTAAASGLASAPRQPPRQLPRDLPPVPPFTQPPLPTAAATTGQPGVQGSMHAAGLLPAPPAVQPPQLHTGLQPVAQGYMAYPGPPVPPAHQPPVQPVQQQQQAQMMQQQQQDHQQYYLAQQQQVIYCSC